MGEGRFAWATRERMKKNLTEGKWTPRLRPGPQNLSKLRRLSRKTALRGFTGIDFGANELGGTTRDHQGPASISCELATIVRTAYAEDIRHVKLVGLRIEQPRRKRLK
jgi:hypothetical protein